MEYKTNIDDKKQSLKSDEESLNKASLDSNEEAWNKGTYDAWVERLGSPKDAAKKIKENPTHIISTLYHKLGDLKGKKVMNLMGSNGNKAVALALLFANVTVVDFSKGNKRYALELAKEAGVNIEYILSDVLKLPEDKITSDYDIVFAEMGILHYFTDLKPFLNLVHRLLSPGGIFIIRDFHPISTKLISSKGSTAKIRKHKVTGDYFDTSLEEKSVSYSKYLNDTDEPKKVLLRRWTIGEIVSSVAKEGFIIKSLDEEPNLSSETFDKGIPKTFTLVAEKKLLGPTLFFTSNFLWYNLKLKDKKYDMRVINLLIPKSITCLKGYTKEQFMKDFSAGIIVAIIALPLSIALAIASGVSPEKGLYTAIIGGFIVSLLGGSRVQIGGPTGAFVVIVYGIIQKYGMDGLLISTIMAGIFLILMGLLKLGSLIKYIPSSITSGFTSGIAIVILSTQVKDFLGLTMSSVPSEFLAKWTAYINSMNTINIQSLSIAILTLLIIILWPKISKKIPGTFVAIIIATIIAMVLNLKIDTIGSQFGELSSALPKLVVPKVSFEMINQLMLPALTIAILAGVESLLSAVVADGMIGGKHRSNMELIAEGVANIFSGMFGGIPVTGAIARTAANVKNGGRTPVAGIVHSFGILIIMMLFMPYVKLIPMASLASILVLVAYNMMEWESFKQIFKAPKGDALVFIVTFILTIFLDLVVAIGVGVVLSSFLFMKKMAEVTDVKCIVDDINDDEISDVIRNVQTPKDVSIYEISGPFFFGAANKFVNAVREMGTPPKILIIKMESVPFIDGTAYHSLEMLYDLCEKHYTKLIILQIQEGPLKVLKNYGFTKLLGEDNFCNDMDGAIERAKALKVRAQK